MKTLKTLSFTICLSLTTSVAALAQTLVITDAKIVTNAKAGTIETGSILMRNGRIITIAQDITTPAGAEEISAAGQWITPGLIVPFSQIGLVDISGEARTNDTRSEKSKTSISELAADSFNPKAVSIANTRLGGITHAVVSPDMGMNIFSGIGLIADTSGDFDSALNENAFVYVQLGSRGADKAGGSRSAALAMLRAALDDAAAYPSRYTGGPDNGDTLSRRDAEALALAARGYMPILIGADRASDILTIIDLKEDYGDLDIIIVGAAEGWLVADQIKKAEVKDSFDKVGASVDNIVKLDEAEVDYAIATLSAGVSHNVRVLTQHAGNAVGYGLAWNKAFAAVTSTPARWFRLNDLGTVEAGTKANMVIWDGDPLEVTSAPVMVFIDGEEQPMESRQRALRDRYNPSNENSRPHKYR